MNYVGLKCPVCGKPFSADDDIVVCPQCGAPYHRECYAQEGKCIYTDRHGTPDAWKPPQQNEQAKTEVKRCPRCGAPNTNTALFCAHCGQPLSEENQPPYGNPFPYQTQTPNEQNAPHGYPPQGNSYPPENGFPGAPFPFQFDPYGGVNPSEPIDNIPAGDVAKFIQGNTQYYLPVFMNIKRFARNRFNFSAFFFQGIWMLYRKQYKIGAVITALQGALLFGYLFIMKYLVLPLYDNLCAAIGITKNISGYSMTADQQTELFRQIYALPVQQKLVVLTPALFFLATFVLMLICGFIGNKLYLKHCVTKINKIRSETAVPTEFAIRLQQDGGLNTAVAAALGLCFLIILFFTL